jgi:hypothetical protein
MELELWSVLSQAICEVARRSKSNSRDTHRTALIVRVYLWACLHDRPVSWACKSRNWSNRTCLKPLPDQSTMSRRMRRADFESFLQRMTRRLSGKPKRRLMRIIDGKALELPYHTTDRNARFGRGVSRQSVGYKLHMICSGNPMPDSFVITPLNTCEKQMAARMIRRVDAQGYLLADPHYDASWLFDVCRDQNHQLLCPRRQPGTGLGHHYHSRQRLRCIDMMESPGGVNDFGLSLYARRTDIEREFAQLVSFGGGLLALPPWARRIWRVRYWVWGKLLINAARITINRSKAA